MRKVVVVLDNIRSAHNVGSIFRTADGLGVDSLVLCGITPRPAGADSDDRLPHIIRSAEKLINKTALGAQNSVIWSYFETTYNAISHFNSLGFHTICLEQSPDSVPLIECSEKTKGINIALIVGPEVEGINDSILKLADSIAEISMQGSKESFNVSIASAIAMYELTKA